MTRDLSVPPRLTLRLPFPQGVGVFVPACSLCGISSRDRLLLDVVSMFTRSRASIRTHPWCPSDLPALRRISEGIEAPRCPRLDEKCVT